MYYLETIHVFPSLSHTKHSRENCSSFRAVGVRTSPATVWRLEGMPLGSLHLLHQLLTPKIYWRYRKGHEDIPPKVKPSEKHEVMFQWVYVLAVVFVSLRIVLFTVEVVMQLQVFNLLCWDIIIWWINIISRLIVFGRLILNTVQWNTNFLNIWTDHLFDVNSHLLIAAHLYYTTVMFNSKLEIAYETKPLFKQMFTNFWMAPNSTL